VRRLRQKLATSGEVKTTVSTLRDFKVNKKRTGIARLGTERAFAGLSTSARYRELRKPQLSSAQIPTLGRESRQSA